MFALRAPLTLYDDPERIWAERLEYIVEELMEVGGPYDTKSIYVVVTK